MANAAQTIQAGFRRGIVHLLDTSGYAMGITGSLSNGSDAGSYQVQGVKAGDFQLPEPDKTDITGDDRFLGAFVWPLSASPSGSIEMAVYDQDLFVALEGTTKRTLGGAELHVLGGEEASPQDVCMIFQSEAKSRTSGYVGLSKKFGLIIPKASVSVLGPSTLNERGEINARLSVTIQTADQYPWGEAFSLANEGVTNGVMIPFTSDYWVDLHAFVGDGTATTVTLDHTPAGDGTGTPARVKVWKNGTALTVTTDFTVNTSTKVVTFTSAPAAGDKVEIWYEWVS